MWGETERLLRPDRSQPAERTAAAAEPASPQLSLYEFLQRAWPYVEPKKYVDGWHIEEICAHLEAQSLGYIRNLIINVPPRSTKSLTTSVIWPAWEWTWHPSTQWLFASYALSLSLRDSVRCRRLVQSPFFRELAPDIRILDDQGQKGRWELSTGGYRISTSVDGSSTGEGGDRIVVDDPHNVREAQSEVQLQTVRDWWDQVMPTRLNDAETGTKTIIMQRVHEADLTGHILSSDEDEEEAADEDWQVLRLPNRYEPQLAVAVTWQMPQGPESYQPDPRTEPGELLCPARQSEARTRRLEIRLGPYMASGQLQQNPSPIEGGLFKRDWWGEFYPELALHQGLQPLYLVLDTAAKTGIHNDFSTASVWGEMDGKLYVLDCWRERVEYPELKRRVRDLYEKWRRHGPTLTIACEDASSGIALIQEMRHEEYTASGDVLEALPVIAIPTRNQSLIARASVAAAPVAGRIVYLPANAPWREEWLTEHAHFPNGAHDDMVANTAIAVPLLLQGRGQDALVEFFEAGPIEIAYGGWLGVE